MEKIVALVALAGIVIALIWIMRTKPRKVTVSDDESQVIREFKSVFFNVTDADRERMISHWTGKTGGNRTEAMRLAIEKWRIEQRSWRL